MKRTILYALILLFNYNIKAQIFSEDFNSGIPNTFTLTDVDGLTPNSSSWSTGSFFANTLTSAAGVVEDCAISVSWFNPVGRADDWMVTPAITLPNTTNGISLQFDAIGWESAYPDGVEVYVSTTGTQPSNFTATANQLLYNSTPTNAGPNPGVGQGEPDVWTTRSVSLNSYVGQTIYIAFRNNSNDMNILGIDNVVVRELQDNNAELTSLNMSSLYQAPANITISGTVTNVGGNNISSMDVTWSDGTNSYTDNISSINILPGNTYNFNHNTQLNLPSPNSVNITVTIDNVNGSVDPDMSNNSLNTTISTVSSFPDRRVVFEEATGTWCGWCPRGAVALEQLQQSYPESAIGIGVHNGDAMTVNVYDAGMTVGGYPSGHVDRAILDVDPGDFMSYYNSRINTPTVVDIAATAVFNNNTRNIEIELSANFVASLQGDYRFNAVILEDGVGPYNQTNYYGIGGPGNSTPMVSPISGFNWNNASSSASVYFDHVARAILGGFDGTSGSLPSNITPGTYTFNYTHNLPNSQDENNVHVVGMVINNQNGEIENAIKVDLSNPNSNELEQSLEKIDIFPNPAKDAVNINGEYLTIDIYTACGKLVLSSEYKSNIDVSSLLNGVYIMQINTRQGKLRKKITIAK